VSDFAQQCHWWFVTGKAKRIRVDPQARRPAVFTTNVLGRGSPGAPLTDHPHARG